MVPSVQLSMGTLHVPPMTNAAALGWAIDDDADPITITAPSVGEPTGGAVGTYDSSLAMRLDGTIVYRNPSRRSARYLVALVSLPARRNA